MAEPDMTGEELRGEYEAGRRKFSHLQLDGITLSNMILDGASFQGSSLRGADFTSAELRGTEFSGADLTEASLGHALIYRSYFLGTTLTRADLRWAGLLGSSFQDSVCIDARLDGALVAAARFKATFLAGACFDDAVLDGTYFFDQDVTSLCDSSSVLHQGPSSIDPRTVMRSYEHPQLKPFMVDCGVPYLFAEYMIECAKALGGDVLHELMQSTFISYGGPDEPFARRLYDALRAHGVVTFFFPETARVGERIGDEVFNALQRHDRMILVCSRASLDRPGVLNEVQETLDREARDGGATYLIPVMLDDYLLTGWKEARPELAERVGRRVTADFSEAGGDPAKFDAALSRLLAALRKKGPGYTSPV